jgi:hypothetical protein
MFNAGCLHAHDSVTSSGTGVYIALPVIHLHISSSAVLSPSRFEPFISVSPAVRLRCDVPTHSPVAPPSLIRCARSFRMQARRPSFLMRRLTRRLSTIGLPASSAHSSLVGHDAFVSGTLHHLSRFSPRCHAVTPTLQTPPSSRLSCFMSTLSVRVRRFCASSEAECLLVYVPEHQIVKVYRR